MLLAGHLSRAMSLCAPRACSRNVFPFIIRMSFPYFPMVSLEEQVLVDGASEKQVQQRRYPAISPDEVRRRILELGVSEENVHRYLPVDPETFANNT